MARKLTIYWKTDTQHTHQLQVLAHLPISVQISGEQYVEVDDWQFNELLDYQRHGLIEFRNKELHMVDGRLMPLRD